MFNYYSDGGNIFLTQPKFSYENKKILEAHGIDPNNPTLPQDVLDVASSIAQKCNKELGIISGIDFILNDLDNKWYYLEIQAFPAIDEWANTKGIRKIIVNNVEDYIKYCAFELEARYEALIMYVNNKTKKQEETKIKKLTL